MRARAGAIPGTNAAGHYWRYAKQASDTPQRGHESDNKPHDRRRHGLGRDPHVRDVGSHRGARDRADASLDRLLSPRPFHRLFLQPWNGTLLITNKAIVTVSR
jgi:hypothetical protein